MNRRPRSYDHHQPCPGGCNQLADECACPRPNPLGSMRIEAPIGSRSAPFPARHPGRCHADCGQWIDRGDLIRMTDDGAVHDDCVEAAQVHEDDALAERTGLPPACPKCWLHHAGECDR